MSMRGIHRVAMMAALAAAAAVAPGCNKSTRHDQAVNAATDRYNAIRSGMMLQMAQQQFDTGDLEQAEKTVREALAVDQENARLHVLAGRIALERGQLERSYHLLDLAIQFDPALPTAHYYQGVVLQRWRRPEQARERYAKAYELQPDRVEYLLAESEMLVELDRTDEAVALLEEKLTYFDQNAAIRVGLAHLYMMKRLPQRSAAFFDQASVLDPENPKIREELALAQLAAGRHESAIANLERVLKEKTYQHRTDLRRLIAAAHVKTGRTDLAREAYLALARGPEANAGDWVRLGELAMKENDLFSALEAAKQAMRLDPMRHDGYLLAGMVWQARENLDEALRMFDRAAELSPNDAAPLILRGISLEKAGRTAAAAEAYAEALRRQPTDTRAQRLLSNVR